MENYSAPQKEEYLRHFQNILAFNDKENLCELLNKKLADDKNSKDTVLIALDFARLLGMSQMSLEIDLVKSIEELMNVTGIGEKKFNDVKEFITVN